MAFAIQPLICVSHVNMCYRIRPCCGAYPNLTPMFQHCALSSHALTCALLILDRARLRQEPVTRDYTIHMHKLMHGIQFKKRSRLIRAARGGTSLFIIIIIIISSSSSSSIHALSNTISCIATTYTL